MAPTGGPVDRTAPRLVASSPEADAVRVTGRTVRLTFSERIDAATALRAVTVTPEAGPGEPVPQVSASGDELVVQLPALRDSTTYVVTVGTELADRRGVRLPAPVTLAFATGPELDRGELAGTVRLPSDGSAVAGLAVFAYRVSGDSLPDPRTARPDARTETGPDGTFRLGYLADQPHFVAALRDLNRNGRADDGEPFAAPPVPRLRPTSTTVDSLASRPDLLAPSDSVVFPARPTPAQPAARAPSLDLWLARRDTMPPVVRAVRSLSDRRIEIRFDEGITFVGGPTPREVTASSGLVGGSRRGTLYLDPSRPAVAVVWLDRPAVGDSLELTFEAVLDSTGNQYAPDRALPVTVSAQPDTATTRILGLDKPAASPDSLAWILRRGFFDLDVPALRLSGPSAAPVVVVGERAPQPGTPGGLDTLTANGFRLPLAYEASVGTDPAASVTYGYRVVRGPVPDTTVLARVVRPGADALGSIVATLPQPLPDSVSWWMEATPSTGGAAVSAFLQRDASSPSGRFVLSGLPPGPYRLRLGGTYKAESRQRRPNLADPNQPMWSGGSLAPYLPPEPLVILAEPVEVRARWETEIDAALLAPLFDNARGTPAPAPER